MFFQKVVVIGVGLIGGSFALALKGAKRCGKVVGFGRSAANLHEALKRGAIDSFETDLAIAVSDADLVMELRRVSRRIPTGRTSCSFTSIFTPTPVHTLP